MLYRTQRNILTVERQIGDDRDLLNRLVSEMSAVLGVEARDVSSRRILHRQDVEIRFPSAEAALAAELWIDTHFEP